MARRIHQVPSPLDNEVLDAMKRLALSEKPFNDIRSYMVVRDGGPTLITVTFFPDEEFDSDPDINVNELIPLNEDGSE